jgi:hypothetical protein
MLLAALLFVPALAAQAVEAPPETPLSAAERTEALVLLAKARTAFLASTQDLTPAQRAWQPGPDRWSVDQCAEHIAVTEGMLVNLVTNTLLPGPRHPEQRKEMKFLDEKLMPMLLDRSHKVKAPEIIAPKARFKAPGEAEAAFSKAHATLEDAVRNSTADWRARLAPHPFFGTLDAYQWTIIAAGHALRHVEQIEEVKNSAGFPVK